MLHPPLRYNNTPSKYGFTLIELSIVLVIIGLIAGGVMVGKDLIRGAQLRSAISEQQRFMTALQAFHNKYGCLPGDCNKATTFFPGATNGNGDRLIGYASAGTGGAGFGANIVPGQPIAIFREQYWAWQQLGEAGLIPGSYSGASGPGHAHFNAVPGLNIPASSIPNGGWCFGQPNNGHRFELNFDNSISLGASGNTNYCSGNLFYPHEAKQIDQKVDDGMPAQGKVIAFPSAHCTTSHTNYTLYSGDYSLTGPNSTQIRCLLNFRHQF